MLCDTKTEAVLPSAVLHGFMDAVTKFLFMVVLFLWLCSPSAIPVSASSARLIHSGVVCSDVRFFPARAREVVCAYYLYQWFISSNARSEQRLPASPGPFSSSKLL